MLIRYEGKPDEYTYRIEMLDELPSSKRSRDYIRFLEETGVEMIGCYIRWVYLRKKKTEGDFDLFSDLDSRINHLTKILYFLVVFIPIILMNTVNLWSIYGNENAEYSLVFPLLNSVVALLLIIGVTRIYNHRKQMKEERCLHE